MFCKVLMKIGSKLSLLSLGLALSMGAISASVFGSNKNASGAKAASTYWVKAESATEIVNSTTATRDIIIATSSGTTATIIKDLSTSALGTLQIATGTLSNGGTILTTSQSATIQAVYPPSTGSWSSYTSHFVLKYGDNYLNRGSNGSATVNGVEYPSALLPLLKDPSRSNYTKYYILAISNGCIKDNNSTSYSSITDSGAFAMVSDITDKALSVFYQATGYNVTFNCNGGTGNIASQIAFNGHKLASSITVPTRGGYTFAGFYDETTGGTMFIDASGNPCANYNKTADCTLYAHWTANQIQLTVHDDNGGTSKLTATYDSPLPDVTIPTKTGYTFTGYFGASNDQFIDANGHAVANGNPYKKTYTIDLYPHWNANTYSIIYNGNGSTSGSTATSSHTYDTAKSLSNNGFSRVGYTFAGWSTSPTGPVQYTNGQSVKNLAPSGSVTLYAKWTPNSYTVNYHGNGNTGGNTDSSSHTFDEAKNLSMNGFEKTGYTFEGWSNSASENLYSDGQSVLNLTPTNGGSVDLNAEWRANEYTINYNGNGSTGGSTESSRHTYDIETPLSPNGFTKYGYTFSGWSTSANGSVTYTDEQTVKNLVSDANGSITLYAIWAANQHQLTVHDDNGGSYKLTATYDSPLPDVTVPTKTGYTFTGYFGASNDQFIDANGHAIANGNPYVKNYTIDLYPHWVANNYQITFNDDNGQTHDPLTVTYDSQVGSTNAPTKTGYTFNGYYDEYDVKYFNADGTSDVTYHTPGNTSVNASWTANHYTITFDAQKANDKGTTSKDVIFDAMPSNIEKLPLKDNYVFAGYYTEKNGQGTKMFDANGQAVCAYTIPNNITLYAYWTRLPGDATLSMYQIINNGLAEDVLTITSSGYTESNSEGSHMKDNTRYFDRPDQFVYRLTGRQPGSAQGLNFVKHADEEETFYIHLDNFTSFNSSWGGGVGFNNKYATYNTDGTISEIKDSSEPIHFIFIITGDNYISGHNWAGASFDGKGQQLTVQFTTIKGGSVNFASAYHQMATSVPVNFNGMDPENVLTSIDGHTRIKEVRNGRIPNLNSYNGTSLVNYVNNASNVKKYSNSRDGLVSALKEQYDKNQPYNTNDFYTLTSIALQPVHNCGAGVGAVEPTCTEPGMSGQYYCDDCGMNLIKNADGTFSERPEGDEPTVIEPLGHNFVSTITKVATTEEAGQITKTCTRCGYTETVEIPKLPKIDVTEETTSEQEAAVQEAVSNMAALIPDVIDQMEAPVADEMTEEEYSEAILKYEEKQEQTAALNNALEKIGEVNEAATTETTQEQKETIKQAQENVVTITETVTTEKNVLDNEKASLNAELEELKNSAASEEEIAAKEEEIKQVEEKQEIIEVVTTQAVVVTAKQTEISEITEKANLNDVPEDAGLGDMGQVFNDFMQKQIDELLGKGKEPGPQKSRALKRAEEPQTQGIDYGLSKEVYKQVEQFVDQTVNNASEMANKVRNCTGVESKAEIKLYVEKITSESFRDFDKAAADAEFAENAYRAVLRHMQGQVLTALEESKPSGNYEQLQSWQEEYDAVSDIEEFEIMVVEVMRVKYNSVSTEVKYDDVDTFMPIYKEIFTNWALNKEDTSGITLEQLTTATVEETTRRVGPVIIYKELESSEAVAVSIFAALAVTIVASAAIVPTVLKKKRRGC